MDIFHLRASSEPSGPLTDEMLQSFFDVPLSNRGLLQIQYSTGLTSDLCESVAYIFCPVLRIRGTLQNHWLFEELRRGHIKIRVLEYRCPCTVSRGCDRLQSDQLIPSLKYTVDSVTRWHMQNALLHLYVVKRGCDYVCSQVPNRMHIKEETVWCVTHLVNFTQNLQCNPSGYSFELHPHAALSRIEDCGGSESHRTAYL